MMPNPKFQRPMPGRQQGAALVIGLFILLIASFLAVASLNNATVQERMASNSEKVQKALRAAESAVEDQVRTAITDFSSFSAAHGEYGKTNPNWPSEAYDIGDEFDYEIVRSLSVAGFAGVAAARGQAQDAARFLGAVDANLDRIGIRFEPADAADIERYVIAAREALGAATYQQLASQGAASPWAAIRVEARAYGV